MGVVYAVSDHSVESLIHYHTTIFASIAFVAISVLQFVLSIAVVYDIMLLTQLLLLLVVAAAVV